MHISVDIETLGSRDDAQILQLSAVAFELNGGVCEPHELLQHEDRWFDATIAPYNGTRDADNEAFWAKAEQAAALARIRERPPVYIGHALEQFSKFVKSVLGKRGKMWALPPQFDLRIVRGNYKFTPFEVPWHYSQEHDLRTLLWTAAKVPQPNFRAPDMTDKGLLKHFGLHDAARQAVLAQAAYRALTLTGAQLVEERRAMLRGSVEKKK